MDYRHDFAIPAGPLKQGLDRIARTAAISIGSSEPIPNIRVGAVRGRMDAGTALNRLLAGLPLRARRIAPGVWRIERRPTERRRPPERRATASANPTVAPPRGETSQEIIVTATKAQARLSDVPGSLSIVVTDRELPGIASPSTADVARAAAGMAITSSAPGQNRIFLRGVADSPFNGPSQATVAVMIDEARLTFDAPDPALRLYDVERVEVLKGPQGPLYGTGILGGIYRIVTRKPEPGATAANATLYATYPGSDTLGAGGSATVNLPIRDTAALRLTAYGERVPGYIDTIGVGPDSNRGSVVGGRAIVRVAPAPDWTLDFSASAQRLIAADSSYVGEDGSRRRSARIAEPTSSDILTGGGELHGSVSGHPLVVIANATGQATRAIYDASAKAEILGVAGPLTARVANDYRIANCRSPDRVAAGP